MDISKGRRHSRLIGEAGEALVASLLSRSGFEVLKVDHVGIDLVAFRQDIGRIGISVKSRTRVPGREASRVNVLVDGKEAMLRQVCIEFGLEPWIAIYVETTMEANLFLTSLDHALALRRTARGNLPWGMRPADLARYAADPQVRHLRLVFEARHWFEGLAPPPADGEDS